MKRFIGLVCLILVLSGAGAWSEETYSQADSGVRIYVNNQAAVPRESVLVDSSGGYWVDSDYCSLPAADKERLSESGTDYKVFYGGKAYYNLQQVGEALNWQSQKQNGTLSVQTSGYQPLISENQESVIVNSGAGGGMSGPGGNGQQGGQPGSCPGQGGQNGSSGNGGQNGQPGSCSGQGQNGSCGNGGQNGQPGSCSGQGQNGSCGQSGQNCDRNGGTNGQCGGQRSCPGGSDSSQTGSSCGSGQQGTPPPPPDQQNGSQSGQSGQGGQSGQSGSGCPQGGNGQGCQGGRSGQSHGGQHGK